MARSVSEIKKSMTDAFMADENVRERYGLVADDAFDDCFSSVSLESVLFYIVAMCCYVLEVLFDNHKAEVEKIATGAVVASVPWYHKMALQYQHGDGLVFDENTMSYSYKKEDNSKRVVRFVAVRDRERFVQILASGEKDGRPTVLDDDVLEGFKAYMNRVKVAGVILSIQSLPADMIKIKAKVYVDSLVIDRSGVCIADGSKPVVKAIDDYLIGILYGGTFNKTKLVDAIQRVEGVNDVELISCEYSSDGGASFKVLEVNGYNAVGGSFVSCGLENSLTYVRG